MWGLILSLFFLLFADLVSRMLRIHQRPEGGLKKSPLNVQECTFAKHHTKQGPERGTEEEDGIHYPGLKQTIPGNQGPSPSNQPVPDQTWTPAGSEDLPSANGPDPVSRVIERSINQNQRRGGVGGVLRGRRKLMTEPHLHARAARRPWSRHRCPLPIHLDLCPTHGAGR